MRTLSSMTPEEKEKYMNLLASATKSIMPPDGFFVIAVFEDTEDMSKLQAHYASNMKREKVPLLLHSMADSLENTL